ncbi:MAG: hypothetical protein IPK82_12870 [Polyangiaceae bacterium]|nr:hypothetical protein [Polyangiaceae bacterium]
MGRSVGPQPRLPWLYRLGALRIVEPSRLAAPCHPSLLACQNYGAWDVTFVVACAV